MLRRNGDALSNFAVDEVETSRLSARLMHEVFKLLDSRFDQNFFPVIVRLVVAENGQSPATRGNDVLSVRRTFFDKPVVQREKISNERVEARCFHKSCNIPRSCENPKIRIG